MRSIEIKRRINPFGKARNSQLTFALILTITLILCSIMLSQQYAFASFPGANGNIVFASDRDGDWELFAMNADGTSQTRLTDNQNDDLAPSWSPDGSKIAYASDQDGDHEIFIMSADGTGKTQLTSNNAWDFWPAWSPDGSEIIFNSNRTGYYEIFIMNVDGFGVTQLTHNDASDLWPVLSPDGSRIAFASNRENNDLNQEGDFEIFIMNTDGSDVTQLTDNAIDDGWPDWCPDGSRIVFVGTPIGDKEIYAINTDGSNIIRITPRTDYDTDDMGPICSPDGTKILFYRDPTFGDWELFVMDADGSHKTPLTENTADDGYPDWHPVPIGNFYLDPVSMEETVEPPSKLTLTINVRSVEEFSSIVNFAVTNIPSGITATLVPNFIIPPPNGHAPFNLFLDIEDSTLPGTYDLKLTGSCGNLKDSRNISIVIESEEPTPPPSPPAPDFSISITPQTRSVRNNSTAAYEVTITSLHGFDSCVSLSVPYWPEGISGTFSPRSVVCPADGRVKSTLTISIPSSVGDGTYSINITGTSGDLSHSKVATLVVSLTPSRCVIVTATYGSEIAHEAVYMRHVRDNMIGSNPVGRSLIEGWNSFYYLWSPPMAQFIASHNSLQSIFHYLLLPLVWIFHVIARIYDIFAIFNTTLASMVAFLFGMMLFMVVYVVGPLLTLITICRCVCASRKE